MKKVINAIDQEIARLQKARAALIGTVSTMPRLSATGRERIRQAQVKRWAQYRATKKAA